MFYVEQTDTVDVRRTIKQKLDAPTRTAVLFVFRLFVVLNRTGAKRVSMSQVSRNAGICNAQVVASAWGQLYAGVVGAHLSAAALGITATALLQRALMLAEALFASATHARIKYIALRVIGATIAWLAAPKATSMSEMILHASMVHTNVLGRLVIVVFSAIIMVRMTHT